MSNWIEVHQDKVETMTVRFLDEQKFSVGFFIGGYMIMSCPLDSLDGVLYDDLRKELKAGGEARVMMFLDL